jgi:ABC-type multidrug transport system ATPase subunit
VTPPLLSCRNARIERAGVPWIDHWDGSGGAERLVLGGYWQPLVSLLSGEARLAGGSVQIAGAPARQAVVAGTVGLALAEADVPRDWTARQYLSQSAELWGMTPRAARSAASATLERLGLGAVAPRRVALLDSATRRAVWLAHAAVGNPDALVVDRPLDGLDADQAELVRRVLETAAEGRQLLVTTEQPHPLGPGRQLVESADAVMLATVDGVVFVGSPQDLATEPKRYLVTALRNVEALARTLEARGVRARPLGPPSSTPTAVGRLVLSVAGDTRVVVDAALDADAPLGELLPLEAWGPGAPA